MEQKFRHPDNLDAADSGARHQYTTAPVTVFDFSNKVAVLPLWIRLPKPGQLDPITSLPRSSMWELIERAGGRIRTVSLRKAGASKGTRLVHLASLLDYLNTMKEGEE